MPAKKKPAAKKKVAKKSTAKKAAPKRKAAKKKSSPGKTIASPTYDNKKFNCAGKKVKAGKSKTKVARVFCRRADKPAAKRKSKK